MPWPTMVKSVIYGPALCLYHVTKMQKCHMPYYIACAFATLGPACLASICEPGMFLSCVIVVSVCCKSSVLWCPHAFPSPSYIHASHVVHVTFMLCRSLWTHACPSPDRLPCVGWCRCVCTSAAAWWRWCCPHSACRSCRPWL
jgi:hypothetical protein